MASNSSNFIKTVYSQIKMVWIGLDRLSPKKSYKQNLLRRKTHQNWVRWHQIVLQSIATCAALHFSHHFIKSRCLDLDFCGCLRPGVNIAKFRQKVFLLFPICGERSSSPIGSCVGGLDGGTWPSTAASAWFPFVVPVNISILKTVKLLIH